MNQIPKKYIIIASAALGVLIIVIIIVAVIINATQSQSDDGAYTEQEEIAQEDIDDEYEAMYEEYIDKYPIAMELPIIEKDWRIDYGICETIEGEFCLMITGETEENRETALEALRHLEYYEENKYSIEFFEE